MNTPRRLEVPHNLAGMLQRIWCNLPLLSATKLDELFCCYLLALLVEMQRAKGKSVLVPSMVEVN